MLGTRGKLSLAALACLGALALTPTSFAETDQYPAIGRIGRLSQAKVALAKSASPRQARPAAALVHKGNQPPAWCGVYRIERITYLSVRDNRLVNLNLGGYKSGARERKQVGIFRQPPAPARPSLLWQGQITFSGQRGGFSNNITVDLSGFDFQRDSLWVHLSDCLGDPRAGLVATRPFMFGDLAWHGRPTFEILHGGTSNTLVRTIKNNGPTPTRACRFALFKVDNRVVRRQEVPALRPGQEYRLQWSYDKRHYAGRTVAGSFSNNCDAFFTGNNSFRVRLR